MKIKEKMMKQNTKKIVEIQCTLDVSEALMFHEGRKFIATLNPEVHPEEKSLFDALRECAELRISVQIDAPLLAQYKERVKEDQKDREGTLKASFKQHS